MSNQVPTNPKPTPLKPPLVINQDWKRFNNQISRVQLARYRLARQIPDLLTLLRLILALVLFGSGVIDGAASPARDIWLLVIGWTTDMADGRIARSMKKERKLVWLRPVWPAAFRQNYTVFRQNYNAVKAIMRQRKVTNTSWLGQHDVYVDMAVSLAVLGYLAVTALVPLWLLLAYLIIWGVLFWRWGIPDIFAQVFQNPIYAAFVFLTVRSEPAVLPWLLLWAGIALLFFWRRLLQLLRQVFNAVRPQAG